jgi:hypothetical protein
VISENCGIDEKASTIQMMEKQNDEKQESCKLPTSNFYNFDKNYKMFHKIL